MKRKVESPGWIKDGKQLLGQTVDLTEDEIKEAEANGVIFSEVQNSTVETKNEKKQQTGGTA